MLSTIQNYILYAALPVLVLVKLIKMNRIRKLKTTYFHDKVVLITGASSGLGKAIAEEMYPLGAQLIICARNVDLLEQLKSDLEIKGGGKKVEVLSLDVGSSSETLSESVQAMIKKFGRIDILINNAGVSFRGESFSITDKVFDKIMNVNFFGAVRLTNLVVNQMIKDNEKNSPDSTARGKYSIVNIGSVQSYVGIPYRSAYCASKHALLAYSDSLRAELYLHDNIDIINCQPGYIDTNVSVNALTSDGIANGSNDDDHRKGFSPNYVGQVVIDSILTRKKEVMITIFVHRFAIWARFMFPTLFAWAMKIRAKKTYANKFQ
jgi:dehydrogenase/reductase SDR family protein 7B